MTWDYEKSKERLMKEAERLEKVGLNVQRLKKEMDLNNLSPTDARIVFGAHFYCDIVNFAELLEDALMKKDNYKRLHRLLHILRVEQRRIVQTVFDGDKIQVQGPKFHGLLYKPYDDPAALAWRAVLISVALSKCVQEALPKVFPEYIKLKASVGLSLGNCLIANIGVKGDRELISVGAAANYAAKIIDDNHRLVVSSELWSELRVEHRDYFFETNGVYVLDEVALGDFEKLLIDERYAWTVQGASDRMKAAKDDLPLDDISSSDAQVRIDYELLGPKTMKTCSGVSLFTDIDGYTAAIDELMDDVDALGKAVQYLHLFRYEMQQLTTDRSGVSVQHQGDRLQAILHLPYDNEVETMRDAVELCIDYNSSLEEVINEHFGLLGKKHVAIGAAFGKSIAIRSGVRGDLDAGVLARATGEAECLQISSKGGEIAISKQIYELLDDDIIRAEFKSSDGGKSYIASGLTWTRISDLKAKRNYESKVPVGFDLTSSQIVFGATVVRNSGVQELKQTRPWGCDAE